VPEVSPRESEMEARGNELRAQGKSDDEVLDVLLEEYPDLF